MAGYYNRPEATSEAIDADGWFHTGDIGEFDSDKYLKITDRKKDIIVTAGGKNIAPQPIENKVKANQYILNAVMVGDKRKFPLILVVPNVDGLEAWAIGQNVLTDPGEFLKHPDVVTKIETEVMGCFGDLASYEIPKKVQIIETDFSIEAGELTPTLKVKRKVVEEKYKDLIDAVYQE
jgi:long-chain acyl-CoA synthetase